MSKLYDPVTKRMFIVSIDYGTKTLAAAYRLAVPGETVTNENIKNVEFVRGGFGEVPQKVASVGGVFHWGTELETALSKNEISADDSFELVKLGLYTEHEKCDIVGSLLDRLQLLDPERDVMEISTELITAHLKAIMAEIIRLMKAQPFSKYTDREVDTLPMQVFISVPQMWLPPINRVMTTAAKMANFPNVQLSIESENAAAAACQDVKSWEPTQVKVGDVLLVADIGGGTGDFVSYELKTSSRDGASVQLQMSKDKKPSGSLCGSEFVNFAFFKWLRNQAATEYGSFDVLCHQLRLSGLTIERRASIVFERMKRDFRDAGQEDMIVTVQGGAGAQLKLWTVVFSGKAMAQFFEPSIQKIFGCISAQLTPKTKWLILPGGFSRSPYLRPRLQERFPTLKITSDTGNLIDGYAIARGALLRYHGMRPQGIPSADSFGIGLTEAWDPDHHPDATLTSRRGIKKADMSKVETDEDDGALNVYERWRFILAKGQSKTPGKIYKTETWQQHVVEPCEDTISVQVYWTKKDIENHDPILDGSDVISGKLKAGIHHWGMPVKMKFPDLHSLGFETFRGNSGDLIYMFYSRMMLVCNGANVEVGWEIAAPGSHDARGKLVDGQEPVVAWSHKFGLLEENFNPNTRSGHE